MWWFRKAPEDSLKDVWGYRFRFTDKHFTEEELRPLMMTYDVLGSESLETLNALFPPHDKPTVLGAATSEDGCGPAKPRRDLYALLRDNYTMDPKLDALWTQLTTEPEWLDWEQIRRGQDVFYRYGGPSVVAVSLSIPRGAGT